MSLLPRFAHVCGLAFLAMIPSLASSGAPPAAAYVQVRGREFITSSGEVLHLRGTNLGNWLLPEGYMWEFTNANSPRLIEDVIAELLGDVSAAEFWRTWRDSYFTREDIRYLRAAGFNSVRVPLNWRLFVSADAPFRFEGPGWALLDRMIGWCRDEGLYVIVDLHAAPGGQTGANIDDSRARPLLFEDLAAQQLTVEFWQALATRYRDETAVIGYDLLNEPIADYNNPARYNPLLAAYYRRLVSAIRAVDPHHVIFLGGAQWNTQFEVLGPPFAPNIAYTFHLYNDKPAESSIRRYLDWREKSGAPMWLGESGENADPWIEKIRLLMESHGVGWCFWTYKKIGAGQCVATAPAPTQWRTIVSYANKPRGTDFDAIRAAAPPYPTSREILDELLVNIRFDHCVINAGYVRALGLKPDVAGAHTY